MCVICECVQEDSAVIERFCQCNIFGNTLKRGGGNVNKVGQRFPIICLLLEPVIIFAVPMILNFLVKQT